MAVIHGSNRGGSGSGCDGGGGGGGGAAVVVAVWAFAALSRQSAQEKMQRGDENGGRGQGGATEGMGDGSKGRERMGWDGMDGIASFILRLRR